jgi:hypothetical protein
LRREERLGSVAVDIGSLGNDAWTFLLELIYNRHSEVVVPHYLPLNTLLYRKVADLPVRTLCRALTLFRAIVYAHSPSSSFISDGMGLTS